MRPRRVVLKSISLPAAFDPPSQALVGIFGSMRTPQVKPIAAATRSSVVALVTVSVEVNRVPIDRIGLEELNDRNCEPFHYLPLGRLRNDALLGFLKTMAPEFEAGREPLSRALRRLGKQLDRVERAIRGISPDTRVASLEVGEPWDRRKIALLLRRDGATILQPGPHHPVTFEFPKVLPGLR